MKKKIAVIGLKGLPAFGGAAAVGENIINNLSDQYSFIVYSVASHTINKSGYLNGGYYQIVFPALPFKKLNTIYYYILSAIHCVFFSRYDLVHLHHLDALFILPLLKLKYKVILTTHGTKIMKKWRKYKFLFKTQTNLFLRFSDVITCVSKNEQREFKIKKNLDVIHIPNGISPADLDDLNTPIQCDYIYFAAGRIIEEKGCQVFLKALKHIKYKGKVIISGDLDQSISLKKELLDLAKGMDVDFTGLIKEKKILFSYIFYSKLFIFPSSKEAMSMMLLEAISLKVPLICSDIIENRDIILEDETLFFKTDDYIDLSEKIQFALNNQERMKDFALKAYKRLKQEYSWINISQDYKKLYDSLIYK